MKIVIVGSGLAGITCAETLKKIGANKISITLITQDTIGYYARPMLSHGFYKQEIFNRLILKSFEQIIATGIDILSGSLISEIDRNNHKLKLTCGQDISYDKLILALGSEAFIPPPWQKTETKFFVLNSFADLVSLRNQRDQIKRAKKRPVSWAIVGGGLIGCEVASDVRETGDSVTIFHAADRLMERQLDNTESEKLLKHFIDKNIEVLFSQNISGFQANAGFDIILVATGFKPRTRLAKETDISINRGIVVNDFLETSDNNIFAIGDVAEVNAKLHPFVTPIRHQAIWLANYLTRNTDQPWQPPKYQPISKIHGLKLNFL